MKPIVLCCLVLLLMVTACNNDAGPVTSPEKNGFTPVGTVSGALESVVEPLYSSQPSYCLITLGPRGEKRMWVAFDSTNLFIDLNANGDITEANEQFKGNVEYKSDDRLFVKFVIDKLEYQNQIYTNAIFQLAITEFNTTASFQVFLDNGSVASNGSSKTPMELGRYPEDAPLINLDGPLSMGLAEDPQELVIGQELEFYSLVGMAGEGVGTMAAISHGKIPQDFHPHVEFVFPNRDPAKPPIVLTSILETRC